MAEEIESAVESRVETVLRVAVAHDARVPYDELTALMPDSGPDSPEGWNEWFREHASDLARLNPETDALPRNVGAHDPERSLRGMRFLHAATQLIDRTLAPVHGLVRCVGVTGSVAFGEPREGDDCDFLVVTRTGATWPFLLYTFLAVRLRPPPSERDGPSDWCFNYVVDEAGALEEYSAPRGFQFAREALSLRPMHGAGFYRALIARAPWMREEAPRLYSRWTDGAEGPIAGPPAPAAVRVLNGLLFPLMAAYLQAVALVRNQRLRHAGRETELFEVVTRLDRHEVRSVKFARLAKLYHPTAAAAPAD